MGAIYEGISRWGAIYEGAMHETLQYTVKSPYTYYVSGTDFPEPSKLLCSFVDENNSIGGTDVEPATYGHFSVPIYSGAVLKEIPKWQT